MPTANQTAANRANSEESTAPRTPQGQTASRFNALKHGIHAEHEIMFDETAEDLAELAAEYHEHHSPADTDQRLLVDTLIHNEWRLRRMRRVEAVLWEHAADAYLTQHPEAEACNSAHAFATNSDLFERLQRMVNACERNYHRTLKELHRLKTKAKVGQALPPANPSPLPQKAAATTPQPQQSTTTSAKLASIRQNPQTPPDAAPPAPPFAGPLAGQHVPASPAEPRPSSSNRFPTPQEAIDAALQAISKESST
jgi:hypothetical protein